MNLRRKQIHIFTGIHQSHSFTFLFPAHCFPLPFFSSLQAIPKLRRERCGGGGGGGGGRSLNNREVCMDFEPCFKVYNVVSVHPKSIKLGQMTSLNATFYVVVSVYRVDKI